MYVCMYVCMYDVTDCEWCLLINAYWLMTNDAYLQSVDINSEWCLLIVNGSYWLWMMFSDCEWCRLNVNDAQWL